MSVRYTVKCTMCMPSVKAMVLGPPKGLIAFHQLSHIVNNISL